MEVVLKILFIQLLLVATNIPLFFSLAFVRLTAGTLLVFVALSVGVFPTLTSIFTLLRVMKKSDTVKDWLHIFGQYYARDWKKAWSLAVSGTVLLLVLTYDFLYVNALHISSVFLYATAIAIVILIGLMMLSSYVLSLYDLTLRSIVWDSVYLFIGHIPRMALIVAVNLGIIALTKGTNWPILQLTFVGIDVFFSYYLLKPLTHQKFVDEKGSVTHD